MCVEMVLSSASQPYILILDSPLRDTVPGEEMVEQVLIFKIPFHLTFEYNTSPLPLSPDSELAETWLKRR